MLSRLGGFAVRRRRLVLAAALLAFAVAGAVGGGVAEHLSSGGFEDPEAESTRVRDIVEREFGAGDPNLVVLVTAKGGNVDAPAVVAAGLALTRELETELGAGQATSYWSLGSPPPLRSENGGAALVLARIPGTENEINDRVGELSPVLTRDDGIVAVQVGGFAEVFRQMGVTIQEDLAKAEGVAIPITLLLLVLVFGSVVAAGLPVAIGILSIIGTYFVLRLLAGMTEVSIFSLNLTTAMGLGLAIDYSLFVVSRFREELRRGLPVDAAVVRTVETAGRTVVFSAGTVAASLAALIVFPLSFLRSFAYAGIGVVTLAALASVVVLPAALAALGTRVDKWTLFRRHPKEVGEGFWHRLALTVMARPLPIAVAVVAVLAVLGLPFFGVKFGLPDDRALPKETSSRQVHDRIREEFGSNEAGAASVVARGIGDPRARLDAVDRAAAALSTVAGVARVDALTGSYIGGRQVFPANATSPRFLAADGTWFSVVPAVEPVSAAGERMVRDIRALDTPLALEVGGVSAQLSDTKASIIDRLPLALGLIGLITFTLLFLMFGSLLVPLKAVALNLLSLSATFGAMVWIFQDGHLAGLLDFTPVGSIEISTPVLMFCIAFGLSMDYEVFLLSRIKEEYDLTGDNQRSVAVGLERTGRIVTAAAALLAVVFVAMATSGVTIIKLFGIGLTMAVLMDATLIRATLVPAFMRLAGNANWWAPRRLRRVYERWGFREHDGADRLAIDPDGKAPQPAPATVDAAEVPT